MKRALCIWLPDWPIQRLTAARPELKGQPVVLHETRRGTRRVVACSAAAAAWGVFLDMPLAEVTALAEMAARSQDTRRFAGVREARSKGEDSQCTRGAHALRPVDSPPGSRPPTVSLVDIPHDPVGDREALQALARWCERFSPIFGLEPSTTPESLWLDVTCLAHLFGGETALAEKVVRDFTCRGLTVRVAITDTIGGAWAVAHFHSSCVIPHSAVTVIPPGELLTALRPLPVEALRLPGEVAGLLHQLGIDRVGQLEALPRSELSSRFGPELARRWDQAIGRLAEPVPVHRPSPRPEADWSPEHPTTRRETIEAALQQLLGQVAAMLARLGRGAVRLECRLDCTSGGPVVVSVGLFQPTAAAGHLFQLIRMQLERLRLPAPVAAMHVEAPWTAPLECRQQELFFAGEGDVSPRRCWRYLAGLIDRLSSRLGRRSVVGVRLVSDAQPELAWHYGPMVENSRRRAPRGAAGVSPVRGARHGQDTRGTRRKPAPADLPPRPLRLLPRPLALAATSIMPGGPPLQLHLHGREHRVAHAWGPERIETGWWRGRVVGRDYYRVETTSGHRFWLFRRLRDGRWFLHGMFE